MSKSIQEILKEQREQSEIFKRSEQSIAVGTSNKLTKTGVPLSTPVWNKGKTGLQTAWNKGVPHSKEQIQKMSQSQKGKPRGPRTQETKDKMSDKAKERWAKSMRKVWADDKAYNNIYDAAHALGIHKDTILYRIKTRPKEYYYLD